MDKERFSLLLLEPSEIYFEDFYVTLIQSNPKMKDEHCLGHLKMCSKSLVFDPQDILRPLIKIPYKNCDQIYQWEGINLRSSDSNVLAIRCSQFIEMLENNILAPYQFEIGTKIFLFNFHYARVSDNLSQICQLHRASSLQAYEQNSMIATIVYSRHNRVKFNPLWLENIYETVIFESQVEEVYPLVVNPGRILLSCSAVYFQPYNNIQASPVIKIKISSIKNIIKRRYLLRHIGLEIIWEIEESENLLYISFNNQNERDLFYTNVMVQENLLIQTTEPESMTLKWQNGFISNYEYLLYLNSLADRSFRDLTQYPIFPWVISNYKTKELDLSNIENFRDLTKPMGAINPERLTRLKERCDEMSDPKFLYGSHYSAPGLVLFYLVRKFPNLMLCLQNGRFDHPDRMFNNVAETFNNCLNNMSDFKELIPEFYNTNTSQCGDFLLNTNKINFGTRFDGSIVNHVILPPWANTPQIFTEKLREALESEYVSKNLNYWIDLIFGYKQRGQAAIDSNNLFYYLCYEGSVNVESVTDLAARHALEVQISEFGQIPKQLFKKPHVKKDTSIPQSIRRRSEMYLHASSSGKELLEKSKKINDVHEEAEVDFISDLNLYAEFMAHKDFISSILVDKNNLITTGKDGVLKCFDIKEKKQIRSVPIASMPISSCIKIPGSNTIVIGSWDNSIITYNLDFGKISNIIPAHDDAVSCLSHIPELGYLLSGSWDGSVKLWKGFDKDNCVSFRLSDSMIGYVALEEKVNCIYYHKNDDIIKIIIGTSSGELFYWIINEKNLSNRQSETENLKVLIKHDAEIVSCSFNFSGTKILSYACDDSIIVLDGDTSMILFKKKISDQLTCLNWSRSDELLLYGDLSGQIFLLDFITGNIEFQKKLHNGFMTYIFVSEDNKLIATGGKEENKGFCVKLWTFSNK